MVLLFDSVLVDLVLGDVGPAAGKLVGMVAGRRPTHLGVVRIHVMAFFNLLGLVDESVSDSVSVGPLVNPRVIKLLALEVVGCLAGLPHYRCYLLECLVVARRPRHLSTVLSVFNFDGAYMRAFAALNFLLPLLSTFVTAVLSLKATLFLVGHREVQEAAASRGEEGVSHLAVLPPDRRQLRHLLVSVLAHLILLGVMAQDSPRVQRLLPAVVASKNISGIVEHNNLGYLQIAFQKGLQIIRFNAEVCVIHNTLRHRLVAKLGILRSEGRALLLHLLLDELALQS